MHIHTYTYAYINANIQMHTSTNIYTYIQLLTAIHANLHTFDEQAYIRHTYIRTPIHTNMLTEVEYTIRHDEKQICMHTNKR